MAEPAPEPQPLWQPPPALVALVAWLRRLRRGGAELLRANPRRIGAAAASLVCGLLLRKMQQQRRAMGVVRTVALSTLLTDIEGGHVARAVVSPTACTYWLRESGKGAAAAADGAAKAAVAATATAATATAAAAASVAAPPTIFRAQMLPLDARLLVKMLHTHKVAFAAQGPPGWKPLLVLLVPFAYLGACGYMLWRMSADLGFESKELGEGGSEGPPAVSFADVAGLPLVKEQVMEVVHCLRNPERYARVGARCPRGVLLAGPPGTGKTLLAKAVAAAAGVPFLACSGSDFVEVFVGRGAKRVRTLFDEAGRRAAAHGGCVLFIDELDAVGGKRGAGGAAGGLEEHEHTLNQLLTQMDGVGTRTRTRTRI